MPGMITSLTLQDKVTNKVLRMVGATDKLTNNMKALDTATNKSVGSGALNGISRVLQKQSLLEKSQRAIYNGWQKIADGVNNAKTRLEAYVKRQRTAKTQRIKLAIHGKR